MTRQEQAEFWLNQVADAKVTLDSALRSIDEAQLNLTAAMRRGEDGASVLDQALRFEVRARHEYLEAVHIYKRLVLDGK